jgi:beta-lactamase regulating signal transducer with metallopeptidase domain
MSDALALVLRLNLALAAAVGLVFLLRRPVRAAFGARIAYGLWAMVPLALAAMLIPSRVVTLTAPTMALHPATWPTAAPAVAAQPAPAVFAPNPMLLAAFLWLGGSLFFLARLVWRQAQFDRAVRRGAAGPAVVGVLRPRIVTPDDFAARYTAREQALVLAHEATHIARQDSRINAAVALARCLAWFNPLVHVFAHLLRIDQELACDAQVVARQPRARRAYAEAMLKTQLALKPLPLGCYWPSAGRHPLSQRIALLARPAPRPATRLAGGVAIMLLAGAAGCAAWAARPADVRWAAAPPMSAGAGSPPVARPAPSPPQDAPARPLATAAPAASVGSAAWEAMPVETPPSGPQLTPVSTPVDDGAPPEGCGLTGDRATRRLSPGDFGPSRRVRSAARYSSVEPGTAVRVYATMTSPDGVPMITDLTAFGSQSWYRVGCIKSSPSRYKLFTSVVQHGDRLTVTALLNGMGGERDGSGQVELASGQSGIITLPNGREVKVTAIARPETTDEIQRNATSEPWGRFVSVSRIPFQG